MNTKKIRKIMVAILVVVSLAGGVTPARPALGQSPTVQGGITTAAAGSVQNERIAFVSDRDGNSEIYVMNADGSGVVRLTDNPAWDWSPSWSPDGRKIAFTSNRDGNGEIYVMNADGSGVVRLTDNPTNDEDPAWSPDGRKIAFYSNRDWLEGKGGIYVMSADGSGVTRLTNDLTDMNPAWSPDGHKIAFDSWRGGDFWQIYVMDADGLGVTNLSRGYGWNLSPTWSPDGSKIAFMSERDFNDEIYVMNADGSDWNKATRLTNNPAYDADPAWWGPAPTRLYLPLVLR